MQLTKKLFYFLKIDYGGRYKRDVPSFLGDLLGTTGRRSNFGFPTNSMHRVNEHRYGPSSIPFPRRSNGVSGRTTVTRNGRVLSPAEINNLPPGMRNYLGSTGRRPSFGFPDNSRDRYGPSVSPFPQRYLFKHFFKQNCY